MAKLYAELTSDKGGRVASKGGDNKIVIDCYLKNRNEYHIEYNKYGICVRDNCGNTLLVTGEQIQLE